MEYYAVVLNIYQESTAKIAEIEPELDYFGIKVGPIKFGKSKAEYKEDVETSTIYKGLSSVKYLNRIISEELYELAQEKEYKNNEKNFLELMIDIMGRTSVDSRQMDILINLDFFSDYGESEILSNVWNVMNGKGYPALVDSKYEDKRKYPLKYSPTYVDNTKIKRVANLKEYIEKLKENPPAERTVYEKIKYEIEYVGYALTKFEDVPKSYAVVIDMNLKYTPVIDLYQLQTGKTIKVKINKKKFYDINYNPIIFRGDVIKIIKTHTEYGKKKIDNKWYDNKSVTWRFIDRLAIVTKEQKS